MSADAMHITSLRYSSEIADAGVVASWDEHEVRQSGWPEIAAEAVRALNHLTSHGDAIPAPVAYEMLGELQRIGHLLPQTCRQLADGLERSAGEHAVYESDGRDPAQSVAAARAELERAAAAAQALGEALTAAQAAIAGQGLLDQ